MDRADVIILGGGLIGLTLAVALDRHGLSTRSSSIRPTRSATLAPAFDGRATAVASASWRMLEAIGVAERLEGEGCPILSIRVSDGLRPGGIVFDAPESRRSARNHGREPAASAGASRGGARSAEGTAADAGQGRRRSSAIRPACGSRSRTAAPSAAPLLVGAEGRNSPTREAARHPDGALELRPFGGGSHRRP